jgi:hypothetical protein
MTLELLEGGAGEIFYSNDIRVLVDLCVRGVVEEAVETEEEEEEGYGSEKGGGAAGREHCRSLYVCVLEQVVIREEFSSERYSCSASSSSCSSSSFPLSLSFSLALSLCLACAHTLPCSLVH